MTEDTKGTYLGDGVFASFDGNKVTLTVKGNSIPQLGIMIDDDVINIHLYIAMSVVDYIKKSFNLED